MAKFSLIVATVGRTDEFAGLLRSLAGQIMRDFELIVIDQNSDDRVRVLLEGWAARVNVGQHERGGVIGIQHLRSKPGLSGARNLGIANSCGEIVAFPDDDCWYYPETLLNIDKWFREHADYGILSVGSRDSHGDVSGNRWSNPDCDLTTLNVFRASATYCYFVRRPADASLMQFDETLGPGAGTNYGAGEDTDLLLTLMSRGIRGRFNSTMYVGHPSKVYADMQRAERYGGGWGRVLAKHSLVHLFPGFVTLDIVRAALYMFLGEYDRASRLYAHGRGITRAYFSR